MGRGKSVTMTSSGRRLVLLKISVIFAFLATCEVSSAQERASEPPVQMGTPGLKDAVMIKQTTPSYTEAAIKAKVQGVVLLKCVIRRDGSVNDCHVLRGLGYGLEENAIKEITSNWRFKPAMLNGKPVDLIAAIEVNFSLGGREPRGVSSTENQADSYQQDVNEVLRSGVKATQVDILGKWYCREPNRHDPSLIEPAEMEFFPGGTVEVKAGSLSLLADYRFIAEGRVRFDWRTGSNLSDLYTLVLHGGRLLLGAGDDRPTLCSRSRENLPILKSREELIKEINSYCRKLDTLSDQKRVNPSDSFSYCSEYNVFLAVAISEGELRSLANEAKKKFEAVLRKYGIDPASAQ